MVANDKVLLAWRLTAAQKSDVASARALLRRARQARRVIADRAYDADAVIESLQQRGIEAVIPSRCNRRQPRSLNKEVYKQRNQVERYFAHLKQYRRLATRYERRQVCFSAGLLLVAAQYQL